MRRPIVLPTGGGLFLWVPSSGVKARQFRYRHGGKPQTATFGKFSKTQGLGWAREQAEAARSKVEEGDHLTRAKAVKRAAQASASDNTFEKVASAWVASESKRGRWTPKYHGEVAGSLANHLGELNALPISQITAYVAARHLRRMERTVPDMASKVRQRLRSIFDYAVEGGLIAGNPNVRVPVSFVVMASSVHVAGKVFTMSIETKNCAKALVGAAIVNAAKL